jgi:alpha-acetolactate decarboxylase
MTNDEIIQIARRAYKSCEHIRNVKIPPEFIERFAKLVEQQAKAEEREACSSIASDYAQRLNSMTAVNIADAIRARGQA